jgi:hypothetical protein
MDNKPRGSEIELYKDRVDRLLEDLSVKVTKISPSPGDVLIVQPANHNFMWTTKYCKFLHENLSQVLPLGVSAVLVDRPDIEFSLKGKGYDD